jgi:predicted phosphodiesterase
MEEVTRRRELGETWSSIAKDFDGGSEALRSRYRRWKKSERRTMWSDVIRPEVIPFEQTFTLPEVDAQEWNQHQTYRQLVFGDAHIPFHDEAAIATMLELIYDYQPDSLVCLGDTLDAYSLSDFNKDPRRKETLQDEINLTREFLGELRMAAPNARIDLLEGNHEARLRTILWRAEDAQKALFNLDILRDNLTWPVLLDLENLGIVWHPSGEVVEIGPEFYAVHGDKSSDPMLLYNVSGISGHSHIFSMNARRTLHDQLEWYRCPTLGTIDPEWKHHPNWQQGLWSFTYVPEERIRAAEPIVFRRGRKTLFNGRAYGI